jgi:hypothetical protein
MKSLLLAARERMPIVGLAAMAAAAVTITACDDNLLYSGPKDAIGNSVAMATWLPTATDTCTREQHDRYSTVGPDGKLYPTWHPPVDPGSGCQFGHEHGRDPRGSDLFSEVGDIPFGYANEQLDIYDPFTRRHEDHVGHKVEWENDVRLSFQGAAAAVFEITCDVLTKLHQGTHSKDAFTNNLHELVYHIRCNDDTRMSITIMAAIGTAGEFVSSCDRARHVQAGTPSPANSPDGGGHRAIPDRTCIERHLLVTGNDNSNFNSALRESWEISQSIRATNGRTLASFNPYFQVLFPSRFFDPTQAGLVGRPIQMCYGDAATGRQARGDLCRESTGNGAIPTMLYDDPRSNFNGVLRFVDINSNRISNEDGPEWWYTDPFGKNGSPDPFPGSVAQFIAKVDNTARQGSGPVLGRDRNYGGPGVHAPN